MSSCADTGDDREGPKIERARGDTAPQGMRFRDSSGSYLDFTGATIVRTLNSLREPPDTSTQIYQEEGTFDPVTYFTHFRPTLVDSDAAKPGNYYYDVQVTYSDGAKLSLVWGRAKIRQDITKD